MLIYAFSLMLLAGPSEKTIGILVFDDVLTSEVTAPAEVFGMARNKPWFSSWRVVLMGLKSADLVTTAEGLTLKPHVALENAAEVDVLIIPGAHDLTAINSFQPLTRYLQKHDDSATWLASNCSGAFVMAHAGLLNGYKATTWFGGEASLAEQYKAVNVVTNQPIVIDRNRLTSNGGLVSYDAAFVLLAILSDAQKARTIYEELQGQRMTPWPKLKRLMKQ